MFKKFKMKLGAKRVKKTTKQTIRANKGKTSAASKIWTALSWPFKKLWALCLKVWAWLCKINLIGLINLTLVVAIVILLTLLGMDISRYQRPARVVYVPTESTVVGIERVPADEIAQNKANTQHNVLPIKKEIKSSATPVAQPVVKTYKSVKLVQKSLAGDLIIDGFFPSEKLYNGVKIDGNMYLQNMNRYTLPCDTHIDGNLILRDVNMLRFCGSFTVTGNIYVNRNSSFGPIPKTARIGGQVIL